MTVLDTKGLSELMRASPNPLVVGWMDREDARGPGTRRSTESRAAASNGSPLRPACGIRR